MRMDIIKFLADTLLLKVHIHFLPALWIIYVCRRRKLPGGYTLVKRYSTSHFDTLHLRLVNYFEHFPSPGKKSSLLLAHLKGKRFKISYLFIHIKTHRKISNCTFRTKFVFYRSIKYNFSRALGIVG